MKKLVLVIAVTFSCTNSDRARSTLEAQGFTNIEITGYSWNGCADSDSTCTGFRAVGPSGRVVEGAVGCGQIQGCGKGCTVRIN